MFKIEKQTIMNMNVQYSQLSFFWATTSPQDDTGFPS